MNTRSTVPLMSERRIAIVGGILVAIGPISMAAFTPAMPELVKAFATTPAAVQMTLTVYFAGFAFAQLICGPLSDGFGRKPTINSFLAIYLVGSVLGLLAPTIELLIAARFLQGIGAAVGVAVARAVVRDVFTHEKAARVINLQGLIVAVGPAIAPTLGGLTLELAGWHMIFGLMIAGALVIIAIVHFRMVETVQRDLSRISARALARSYGALLRSRYFMLCAVMMGGTSGAIYAQATLLPFILIDRVGLTPTQFGTGMLLQTGGFILGSFLVRRLMRRYRIYQLLPLGFGFIATGALMTALSLHIFEPSYLSVMGPIFSYTFGIAFVMPAVTTAALAPFPHNAGAASSLTGFFQMGSGLLGGSAAALLGDPLLALSILLPLMGSSAVVAYVFWRKLPQPAIATVFASDDEAQG